MLHRLSVYLTNQFLSGEDVSEEDHEVYVYGWNMLLSTASSLIAILILALILGQLVGTVLFMVCFLTLRAYAGGYHANSYLGCFLTMIVIYLVALWLQFKTPTSFLATLIVTILLLSVVMIFVRAPQDHPNHPIEGEERIVFTRRSRLIVVIQTIMICALLFLDYISIQYLWWATLGVAFAGLSLFISNWRNDNSSW